MSEQANFGNFSRSNRTAPTASTDPAAKPMREDAAGHPVQRNEGGLVYFRMPFAQTTVILPSGTPIQLGWTHPYWHVTDDAEVIAYLRDHFVGSREPSVRMTESDVHAFNAGTTIQPEILPLPGQAEDSGFTNSKF